MSGQGQGIIGHDCEWCGKPAVDNVLISPATYRVDKRGAREMVHTAQYAWVCDDHTHLALDPDAPPPFDPQLSPTQGDWLRAARPIWWVTVPMR